MFFSKIICIQVFFLKNENRVKIKTKCQQKCTDINKIIENVLDYNKKQKIVLVVFEIWR